MLFLCFAVSSAIAGENEGVPSEKLEDQKKAREIFHENCAVCHGFDGVALLPESPSFARGERLDKSDEDLFKSIKHGKGDLMPPWGETLNDDQCKRLVAYIKSVAGDNVFQRNCVDCHSKKIPPLTDDIPENEKLASYEGMLDICRGSDEMSMEREEIIAVIKFIRTLSRKKSDL